jgi:geranylgeranyl reductase family protein
MWDVAVIGAGPAGLAAASTAARSGARTVLVERGEHPRYKTCGGGLIGTSVRALGGLTVPVRDEVCAATFTLRGRHAFTRREPSPILAMVTRDEFDDALRRKAVADGAELVQRSLVREVSQDPGCARARLADGTSLTAKVMIGADGSASVTAKHVGVVLGQVDLGLEVELAVPPPLRQQWRGRVLLDWGPMPGSYAWIFPKEDRLTAGVIAARGLGDGTRKYLQDFLGQHGLASLERVQDSGHITRCRTAASPLRRGRVLVAGDAAGLLEPWTREGISFALRSGALAGAIAAQAAQVPGPAEADQALDRYTAAINAALIPEMLAGHQLLTAFSRHPGAFHRGLETPKGWDLFAKFCRGQDSWAGVLQHRSARLALGLLSVGRARVGR